jgi:hypothetical protein
MTRAFRFSLYVAASVLPLLGGGELTAVRGDTLLIVVQAGTAPLRVAGDPSRGPAALTAAASSAAVLGLLGAIAPAERWRPVTF